ncbi:HAD family hydrolase [Paenibacillus sp. M1]|uniref:HAD family hydrolase n=1 Tax=Paenibacillus haidiansis TaxID=1574488 RepID=A0ABU7VNJ4_9BACL
MSSYEVVSLDLFQTLVNIEMRRTKIWSPILSDRFTEELAAECGGRLLQGYYKYKRHFSELEAFTLIQKIYESSFAELFTGTGITFDCGEANRIFFREHTLAEFYEDTVPFLDMVTEKYNVCIVSDADDDMVPSFYKDYGIRLFNSEQYRSYKNDEQNAMFKDMLRHYRICPAKAIHIGDSVSDVLGAKREGITACWLNRNKLSWEHEVKPDIVAESLNELIGIL